MNSEKEINPFQSPHSLKSSTHHKPARKNRLRLLFLATLVGVMQGGTAGAAVGLVAAIASVFIDVTNIGMMMFFYFMLSVFAAFYSGGVVGLMTGFVNSVYALKSRTVIRAIALICYVIAILPFLTLLFEELMLIFLVSSFTSTMWVSHHLCRLFELYDSED